MQRKCSFEGGARNSKKGHRLLREGGAKKMKYQFIAQESKKHAIKMLCEIMEVSRSGYYSWVKRPQSNLAKRYQILESKINVIFNKSRQTYGYRRVTNSLKAQGESCGKHQVVNLMRKLNIRSITKCKFKATTDSKHAHSIHDNVLNREFNVIKVNQKWSADITYIQTQEGWLYLAVVIDLFSRNTLLVGRWTNA